MGDPFFDLANFSINHELDADGRRGAARGLLRARPATSDLRALELMRFMSDFREAMWGVVQTAVSELDFDFAGYAAEHFERLRRTAAEPAFRGAGRAETTRGASRRPSSQLVDPRAYASVGSSNLPVAAPPPAARAPPRCPCAPGP